MDAPNQITFRGALYVLAKDKDKADKKGKRTKGEDVFSNVRLRGDGVSFYINVLIRSSKDMKDFPFTRQVRSVPDSVNLTADQLDEALAAKKAGELWHIYAEDVGWFWKGSHTDASKVADIQKVLDLVKKHSERVRTPIISAVVSNKIVGK